MNFEHNSTFIRNSNDYMQYASLFEDFEIMDNLARQRIEENNFTAAMRCMVVMRLILDEIKSYIMQ